MDRNERAIKLEEIRKNIFSELEKSLEHQDSGNAIRWLIALEKVEQRILI